MSTETTATTTIAAEGSAARRRRSSRLASTLRGIYIVWYRDLLRFWRDRPRILIALAQPVLYLIVFGVGLGSSLGGSLGGGPAGGSVSYGQFVYPGVIGMAVLFAALFGAMSIVWDREFGFLKEILVAPIDRSAVAIGKALGGATQAVIQGSILLVLAPVIGVKLSVGLVLLLIPFVFVLAFALSSLGRGARVAHEVDAGLPGRHDLPRHADVLPLRLAVPALGTAVLDDGPHPARPRHLRHGSDPPHHPGRGPAGRARPMAWA